MKKIKTIAILACFEGLLAPKAYAQIPAIDVGAIVATVQTNVQNVKQVKIVTDAGKTIGSINTAIGNAKSSFSKFMGDTVEQAKERTEKLQGYAKDIQAKQKAFDDYKKQAEEAKKQIADAQKEYNSAMDAYNQARQRLDDAKDIANNAVDTATSTVQSATGAAAALKTQAASTVNSVIPQQVVKTATTYDTQLNDNNQPASTTQEPVTLKEYKPQSAPLSAVADGNLFGGAAPAAQAAPATAAATRALPAPAAGADENLFDGGTAAVQAAPIPAAAAVQAAKAPIPNAKTSQVLTTPQAVSQFIAAAPAAAPSNATSTSTTAVKDVLVNTAPAPAAAPTQGFRQRPQLQPAAKLDQQSSNINFSETMAFAASSLPSASVPTVGGALNGQFVFSDELGKYCDISVADLGNPDNMKNCQLKLLSCINAPSNAQAQDCKALNSRIMLDTTLASQAQAMNMKQVAAGYPMQVADPMKKDITGSSTVHDDVTVLASYHKESIGLLNNILLMMADQNVLNSSSKVSSFDSRAVKEVTDAANSSK